MTRNKKLLSLVLTLAVCASTAVSAFAAPIDTAGGAGTAEAVVNAQGIIFSVTVPTALTIDVDSAGIVTTASDAKIVNSSSGAVLVSNVTITPKNEWTGIAYGADMSKEKVNSKKIGMKINDCVTDETGTFGFSADKFLSIAAVNDTDSDEMPLVYDATLPAQATAIEGAKVADVVFTIGWDEVAAAPAS